jgi:hypothetical protein
MYARDVGFFCRGGVSLARRTNKPDRATSPIDQVLALRRDGVRTSYSFHLVSFSNRASPWLPRFSAHSHL